MQNPFIEELKNIKTRETPQRDIVESQRENIIEGITLGFSYTKIYKLLVKSYNLEMSYAHFCSIVNEWIPKEHNVKTNKLVNKYTLYLNKIKEVEVPQEVEEVEKLQDTEKTQEKIKKPRMELNKPANSEIETENIPPPKKKNIRKLVPAMTLEESKNFKPEFSFEDFQEKERIGKEAKIILLNQNRKKEEHPCP